MALNRMLEAPPAHTILPYTHWLRKGIGFDLGLAYDGGTELWVGAPFRRPGLHTLPTVGRQRRHVSARETR
jgi:hypothetical protein